LRQISKAQRKALAPELAVFQQNYPVRDEAMARAYLSGAYTMKEIALHLAYIT
jgi:putative transposase